MMTFLKISVILAFLIIPLTGGRRSGSNQSQHIQQSYMRSRYAVNRRGELEDSERKEETAKRNNLLLFTLSNQCIPDKLFT